MANGASAQGSGRAVLVARALTALAAALLGGCSNPDYPPNLSFPSRTDRLVLKAPEATPAAPGEPGKIVEELAALDSLGGKTLDPRSVSGGVRTALDRHLREAFGTPAAPSIVGDPDAASRLGLTA